MVPPPFQDGAAATDECLRQLRFKREIFADADTTYRVRYGLRGDKAVYWLRIQETFHPDLGHYLRWKLDSDLTPRLFQRLDETAPGLADKVFKGLKACAHCYGENCMARSTVERGGVVREVCGDGWNHIGYNPADYQDLWTVLAALNEVAR
jgi:hypothetical protein